MRREAALFSLAAHLPGLLVMAPSNGSYLGTRRRCGDCPRPARARVTRSHVPLSTQGLLQQNLQRVLERSSRGQGACLSGPGPSELPLQGTGSLSLWTRGREQQPRWSEVGVLAAGHGPHLPWASHLQNDHPKGLCPSLLVSVGLTADFKREKSVHSHPGQFCWETSQSPVLLLPPPSPESPSSSLTLPDAGLDSSHPPLQSVILRGSQAWGSQDWGCWRGEGLGRMTRGGGRPSLSLHTKVA